MSERFIVNPNHLKLYEDANAPTKYVVWRQAIIPIQTEELTGNMLVLVHWTFGALADDANFIIYRLADVMLMRAEALSHLEDADKTEAVELVNVVRARANLPIYDINLISTDTNSLVDIVLLERSLELAMEGKRWYDLVRIGLNGRPEVLIDKIVTSRLVSERPLAKARVADPRSWFLPYHINELAANPNLIQNPLSINNYSHENY